MSSKLCPRGPILTDDRAMDEETYKFRIGAYSPASIPMARLAEYMLAIADVYGERENVHFDSLKKGSTVVVSRVEREAVPKVRDNIQAAQWRESKTPSALAFKRVNKMLQDDNASGEVVRGRAKVLQFPGCEAVRPAKFGPFNQLVSKDGILVRIGGKDSTAHAQLQDASGVTWSFEVSRELAMQLGHHLFSDPVRLTGQGRAVRNEDGEWEFLTLRAAGFQVLTNESLVDVVARLRSIAGAHPDTDPTGTILSLRDDASDYAD
jgi:hypothetical protein